MRHSVCDGKYFTANSLGIGNSRTGYRFDRFIKVNNGNIDPVQRGTANQPSNTHKTLRHLVVKYSTQAILIVVYMSIGIAKKSCHKAGSFTAKSRLKASEKQSFVDSHIDDWKT